MAHGTRFRIPQSVKRISRQAVVNPLHSQVGDWRLRQSVRTFRENPAPTHGDIQRFRRAWGNESYSADASYVSEVFSRVRRCVGPILECGSGLTTLVAALAAEARNLTIWSLEQDLEWVDLVKQKLKRHRIRNVVLKHAPLKEYRDYVWYDVSQVDLPSGFECGLWEGPAVGRTWGRAYAPWRYGVLPVLRENGIAVDEILLDDADEPRAAGLLASWKKEFDMGHHMLESSDGDCAVVRAIGAAPWKISKIETSKDS